VTARIVDVAGFDLVTGHTADGELRASASVAPSCTRSQFASVSASWSATTSGLLVADYAAGASRATTATLAAAASVASPTDISSSLLAGTGSYGPGTITIPGYDQAYKVTVSNANIVGYSGSNVTPGIRVYMPAPSTPNAAHWLTIVWTISGTQRRVFHDIRTNWLVNGDVIEPATTAGSVATLSYTWDTTAHGWYVSASSGNVSTRTHGPDEASTSVPLWFSPETRALGTFADIKAGHINALESMPSGTLDGLGARGIFVDIGSGTNNYTYGSTTGYVFESIHARVIFDGAWNSGANGQFNDPSVQAVTWLVSNGAVDGRVMMHELGHAVDQYGLADAGHTWGVDPMAPGSPNGTDTVVYDAGGGYTSTYYYTPSSYSIDVEFGGVVTPYGPFDRPQFAFFSDEQPVRDIYAGVADKPGSYYRSTITEWAAQCFMLCWADHVPGYDSTGYSSLVTEVGGSSIFNDFRDYAVTTGVLPSSW